MSTRRAAIMENREGPEKPDPTPLEIPDRCNRPPSLREDMMRFIRNELSNQARAEGKESFEEFDDLEIDDGEDDLTSPYTVVELKSEEGAYLLEPEPETPQRASETPANPTPDEPGLESPKGDSDNTTAPGS